MENKKDIGTIFREQLHHLDKSPNDDGWNTIQSVLDKKKKRKVTYVWSLILLLFSTVILSSWLVFFNSSQTNKILNYEEKETSNEQYNSSTSKNRNVETDTMNSISLKYFFKSDHNLSGKSATDNILYDNLFFYELYSSSKKRSGFTANDKIAITDRNVKIKNPKSFKINKAKNKYLNSSNKYNHYQKDKISLNTYHKPISDTSEIDKASVKLYAAKSVTNVVMERTDFIPNNLSIKNDKIKNQDSINNKKLAKTFAKKDTTSENIQKRKPYTIYIYGSPTSRVFSSKNSTLDSRLNTNSKKSKIIINYGSYINYEATENFSVRFGIGRNKSAAITEKALVNTPNYSNIEYKTGFSNKYILNQSNNSEFMQITQEISYIEIPVEVKYNIIRRKIGLNTMIGLNYLFLSDNEVSVATESGYFAKIGKTSKLLSNTFGANIAIGIDYKISPRIKINIEPMLKYQLKTTNDLESNNIINFNILTGVEFSLFNQK